ncbi:MAG: hypothetical protein V1874_13610 [Spirochaetota bacterium]
MNRPGAKPPAQKEKPVKEPVKETAGTETGDNPQSSSDGISPEKLQITEEITELLSKEDIITAIKKFKADSEEKNIVAEFVNSHILFLNSVIESDYKKGINRSDAEIRDLVSNVNMMLRDKDEYLFTTIIAHCHLHYRNIQKKYYSKIKKEEEKEGKK